MGGQRAGQVGREGGEPRLAPGHAPHARTTLSLGSGGALMRETW